MQYLFPISKYTKGYCPAITKFSSSLLSKKQKAKRLKSSILVYDINKTYITSVNSAKINNKSIVDFSLQKLVSSYLNNMINPLEFSITYFQRASHTDKEKFILNLYYSEHISIKEISIISNVSDKTIKRIIDLNTERAISHYE